MAVRISYKEEWDSGAFLFKIVDLWALQDRSQVDRQRLLSYLNGLLIPAREGKYPALNEELRFLQSIARIRK